MIRISDSRQQRSVTQGGRGLTQPSVSRVWPYVSAEAWYKLQGGSTTFQINKHTFCGYNRHALALPRSQALTRNAEEGLVSLGKIFRMCTVSITA